ncbi:MAG: recombination protein RecR [Deltaproteobacteria bacterium]|nr:recombination protein RecR [Deltaproteobacteria bacterium]
MKNHLPQPVLKLIDELRKLPGVGEKTATRYVLNLMNRSPDGVRNLEAALSSMAEGVKACDECGFVAQGDLCDFCGDPSRDRSTICVAENVADVLAIEKVGDYRGLYHVLGGVISVLRGVTPEGLRIKDLAARVADGGVREVILATGASAEGETTALYIRKLLEGSGVKVSRPATGIPMGSSIEYLDAVTLMRALRGRKEL